MVSRLEKLRKYSRIVADTGDFLSIKEYSPCDVTTNPTLIYKSSQMDEYEDLVVSSLSNSSSDIQDTLMSVSVAFGAEILKIIPGRVSVEVDARLSFDTEATVECAKKYIEMYAERGVPSERVLIKLASTWESIRACKILEAVGIHCNMTLIFSLLQAVAAADAGATLISPFVGRMYDWQRKKEAKEFIPPEEDLGVISVTNIFNYYKKFGYKTEIMGASFRNTGEILSLAGCDLLTISIQLLQELSHMQGDVPQMLKIDDAKQSSVQRIDISDEKKFRFNMCANEVASEKLYDGIRSFTADIENLEKFMLSKQKII